MLNVETIKNKPKVATNKKSNFRYFIIGVISTLLVVTLVLGSAYFFVGHPYLDGLSYNIQLDEATLKGLGIHPTSNQNSMRDQMVSHPCYVGNR
jgi:hypothetical protein